MAGNVFYIYTHYCINAHIYYPKIGCLAGAAQSIIATPLDSLKVRFEVSDLLEGKHSSMYQFAKSTLKELGIASAYRGFTLTLIRVRLKYECGKCQLIDLTNKFRIHWHVDCFLLHLSG